MRCLPALIRWFLEWSLGLARWWILRAERAYLPESLRRGVRTLSKPGYTVVFWLDVTPIQSPLQEKAHMSSDTLSISPSPR